MTAPSSFNVSGLLGSNAIDTTTLVSQLVQAAAVPQTTLKNQLSQQQTVLNAFQTVNTQVTALQSAANAVLDPALWTSASAVSNNSAVVATATGTPQAGTTTFDVAQLASAKSYTINFPVAVTAGNGTSVSSSSTFPMTITSGSTSVTVNVSPSSSADSIAQAINTQTKTVSATVIHTGSGDILQITSSKTGVAGDFSISTSNTDALTGDTLDPNQVKQFSPAQDAKLHFGGTSAGAFDVFSSTNTFTNAIAGVTFSVAAPATNVSVTVGSDTTALAGKVKSLVDALNTAKSTIKTASGQNGVLEGRWEVASLSQQLSTAFSSVKDTTVTPNKPLSLKAFGIDIDKNGVASFDAAAFSSSYAANSTMMQSAVTQFATALKATADSAVAPVSGALTSSITAATTRSRSLNDQIDKWTTRLTDLQTRLQTKYAAMNSTMARLQSQQTYLTNVLKAQANAGSSNN